MLFDFDDDQRDRDSEIAKIHAGLQTPGTLQVGIGVVVMAHDLIGCLWLLVGGGVKVTEVGVCD